MIPAVVRVTTPQHVQCSLLPFLHPQHFLYPLLTRMNHEKALVSRSKIFLYALQVNFEDPPECKLSKSFRGPLNLLKRGLIFFFFTTDTSLKDGLFHEFKKHGKVTSVQIHGASEERYGLVFFRQQEDQEKALVASKGKLFFGMQIDVTAWNGPGEFVSRVSFLKSCKCSKMPNAKTLHHFQRQKVKMSFVLWMRG